MIRNIFVVGTGTMGLDIAQVFANGGYKVTANDISQDILNASKARLQKGLSRRVERGKLTQEDMDATLAAIAFDSSIESAANADLVIEAIVENVSVKRELFSRLDEICKEHTIFATNTSSISITQIASATKRADRFIGMHFFNPATIMKLVEVIRGAHTSDETYKRVCELSMACAKTPVEVAEAPGFVVNRLLIPMINEAVAIFAEGVATADDIDTAMKLGANHPMGPLALADLIGLDVCLAIMDTLCDETRDPKYRAHPLLRKMVRGGMLGKKTGRGFFEYS